MLDPLIVADVVARTRCAVSLAFDVVKRRFMRYDALPLSSLLASDKAELIVLSISSFLTSSCFVCEWWAGSKCCTSM